MNALIEPCPGRWTLVVAPRAANHLLLELIAALAQRGPVRVLDGGDRFQAHAVARALAFQAHASDGAIHHRHALGRIQLARAFTCYQMVALLQDLSEVDVPIVVLDLLATFYDESVSLVESQRLLRASLACLSRLSARAPLAVSARAPRQGGERAALLDRLASAAGRVWRTEPPESPSQPRLFQV
jgi:hypothetical protein